MEPDLYRQTDAVDPAHAFMDLRLEVSLLRRAIEGLTAERQNTPDYTPTLTEMATRLGRVERFLGKVSESPAMLLTPESLASRIADASATVRAGDREILARAEAVLNTSIASINAVVAQAWTADRQKKNLYWMGGAAFVFGILSGFFLLHFG